MSTSPSGVTIRPITGPDEIALFNRLPYTINHELDDDLAADWREDPDTYRAVRTRMGVLESTGARLTVERLRLKRRPAAGLPTPDQRLAFRPALDTDELVALMTRVLDGALDAHSRTGLAQMSPHEAALKHYEQELATYSSPREWWRIGTLGENGDPVGFVIPARNAYHPVIAYLGVVPEHRGHGYVDGLLAEGTRTPRRRGRPTHPRGHRPGQRTHGKGLRPRRLRQLRAGHQHGLALTSDRRGEAHLPRSRPLAAATAVRSSPCRRV
ncbi:hypothetical protein ABZ403_19785 [Micromonospora zamorensis]|uniref:hypothetical protein n=1 Tax=Micromonospora zamorensis TaxID=709883 RepID=UPI0033CEDC4D